MNNMETNTKHSHVPIQRSASWHHGKMILAAISLLGMLAANLQAEPIYRETFGFAGTNPGDGETTAFNTVGWTNLYSIGGGNIDPASAPDGYYLGVTNQIGSPINLPDINSSTGSASEQYGAVRLANLDGLTFKTLVYTNEYVVDRSAYQVDTISWYGAGTGGGSDQDSLSAAVQIDGLWYVSALTRPNALSPNDPSSFSSDALQYMVSLDSATWFSLTTSVGSPFVVGTTPVALPSGNIESFGMYADLRPTNGSYLMFDTFQIDASAIPEPATTAMMILGLGMVVIFRFRWRKTQA